MRTLALLGSTGSIGTQTLDVVRAEPDAVEVVALAAASSVEHLAAQAREFRPKLVAIADATKRDALVDAVPPGTEVLAGDERPRGAGDGGRRGAQRASSASPGCPSRSPRSTAGKRLALANKESLIAGGPVVQRARATPGAELVPVDSEHCAVHQCLRGSDDPDAEVARIVLTAVRRAVPRAGAPTTSPRSPSTTPSPIRRGPWGRRSPSTRRR